MAILRVEGLVGEITQRAPEGRANQHGVFSAASGNQAQSTVLPVRKPRAGGCKTCQGRGCSGNCKF
jgi:hypothetical protein